MVGWFYLRSENRKAVQSGARKTSVPDRENNKHNSKKQMRKTVACLGKEGSTTVPKRAGVTEDESSERPCSIPCINETIFALLLNMNGILFG